MLTREEVMEIRVLHRQGMSIRGIARATGVSRNVVRRYLRSPEAPRYKRRVARRSKLDPFKSYIAERLRAAAPSRMPDCAADRAESAGLSGRHHDPEGVRG